MASAVDADGTERYHEIQVDVASLSAWSAELHRLVGLTGGADNAVGHWSVNSFVGNGPPGSLDLRDLNAEALATLAGAVEQLDALIARLRDAAAQVAASYADADAYAQATTESVQAALRGEAAAQPVDVAEPVTPPGDLTALDPSGVPVPTPTPVPVPVGPPLAASPAPAPLPTPGGQDA